MKIILNLLIGAFITMSLPVCAGEWVPRLGVNASKYTFEYDVVGDEKLSEKKLSPTAGLLYATKHGFIDLSTEIREVNWATLNLKRSELALTLGYPVYHSLYIIGGYRMAKFGNDYFSDDIGYQRGSFYGISINNLRMGDSTRDIFSLSYVYQPAKMKTTLSPEIEDGLGYSIKVSWRRAGTPHLWSAIYQSFGAELEENVSILNYSYLFTDF